jgi:hypothetical protein
MGSSEELFYTDVPHFMSDCARSERYPGAFLEPMLRTKALTLLKCAGAGAGTHRQPAWLGSSLPARTREERREERRGAMPSRAFYGLDARLSAAGNLPVPGCQHPQRGRRRWQAVLPLPGYLCAARRARRLKQGLAACLARMRGETRSDWLSG